MASKRYDFFISYAHEDLERVRELDTALRALLRRPLRRAGFQVFRDETSLAADPDLTSRLRAALDQSSWLLVALTPASVRSPWVDQEIQYWCEDLGRSERLLIVHADATIDLGWDEETGRFRSPASLPPALFRTATAQPLYVEMGAGPVEDAAVRVAAAVLGRTPDDIAGEDLRLYRRRKRLATAAISGLVLLTLASAAASVLAIRSSAAATRNEDRAVKGEQEARKQARQAVADALAARALVEQRDRPDKAFALALASTRLDPSGSGEPVLLRLVAAVESTDRFYRVDGEPTAVALSPGGDSYVIGDAEGRLRLGAFAAEPAKPVAELGSPVIGVAFTGEDRVIAGLADRRILNLELSPDGALTERSTLEVPALDEWAFDPRTGLIAVLGWDEVQSSVLTVIDTGAGALEPVASRTEFESFPSATTFDRGGSEVAVAGLWAFETFDVTTAEPREVFDIGVEVESVALGGDGTLVVGGTVAGSNVKEGLVIAYGRDGTELSSTGLSESVDSLAACGDRFLFGTRAGEYGWIGDPVSSTRPTGDVLEPIRSVACEGDGAFIVVGERGLVHMRMSGDTGAANAFRVFRSGESNEPGEILRAGLAGDRRGLHTDSGQILAFTEPVRELDELLSGESTRETNCASIMPLVLGSSDPEPGVGEDEVQVLARCGMREIQAQGPAAQRLTLAADGGDSFDFGAGGAVPYSLAWSADGRQVFVGGDLDGKLYTLSERAPPQEVVRLRSVAFFSGASFAADGHVLIASVHYPPSYNWDVSLFIIGGLPLERLSCRLAQASLDDTVALELLSGYSATELGCDAVADDGGSH